MKQGCTSSKELSDFRKTHDVRLLKGKVRTQSPAPETPSGGFGLIRTGAPESMTDVMSNTYQRKYVEDQTKHLAQYHEDTKQKKASHPRHTKASLAQVRVPEPEPKEPFKLKQFQDVPPKVQVPKS